MSSEDSGGASWRALIGLDSTREKLTHVEPAREISVRFETGHASAIWWGAAHPARGSRAQLPRLHPEVAGRSLEARVSARVLGARTSRALRNASSPPPPASRPRSRADNVNAV